MTRAKAHAVLDDIVRYADNLGEPLHPFVVDFVWRKLVAATRKRRRKKRGKIRLPG